MHNPTLYIVTGANIYGSGKQVSILELARS